MITLEEIKKHDDKCEETKRNTRSGEWTDEPNRINWKSNGLDCMIVRNPSGLHLCGYVGVTPEHPYFDKTYDQIEKMGGAPDVHGGLTYSDHCDGHICHIKETGEDKTFWIGFDCAHSGDLSPGHREDTYLSSYKDFYWVKRETENLARQVSEVVF